MIRELFAIRHNPTGGFLPEVHKGYTYSEPETFNIPRLFLEASSAKRALTWWLKGGFSVAHVANTDPNSWVDEIDEVWTHVPMCERKSEDMEVVPVLLKL